jgi:hypothetical protein
MRHLSKLTGDQSRDVVLFPHRREGLNGGLSQKIREAPPTQPQRESVTSRSLAGNIG